MGEHKQIMQRLLETTRRQPDVIEYQDHATHHACYLAQAERVCNYYQGRYGHRCSFEVHSIGSSVLKFEEWSQASHEHIELPIELLFMSVNEMCEYFDAKEADQREEHEANVQAKTAEEQADAISAAAELLTSQGHTVILKGTRYV